MGFTKSVTITFLSNTLLLLLSIITTTILSRLLGPTGKGVVDVAKNFLAFAILFLGFGLASANVFFLGKNKKDLGGVVANNLFLTLISAIALIPFYLLNAHFHFSFLRGVSNLQLVMVLLAVPFTIFKASMVNILLGLQDVVEYNRINIVDNTLNLVLLVAFLWFLVSPSSALLATLVGAVAVSLWEISILVRLVRRSGYLEGSALSYLSTPDLPLMRRMLGYGLKAQATNVIQKLNYRLDVFIVASFLPISQVGIYGVAVALGETLWGVSGSIATVILPIASAATDKREMYTFTNQVTRVSFTMITLFSLILGSISRPLIIWWLTKPFAPAAGALLWLLPGIAIFSVSNILANYLAGVGLVQKNLYSSILSAIVTVVLDLILIPRIGINGASIATSLSYITFTLTTLYFYLRYTQSRWQDVLILKGTDVALIRKALLQRFKR